MISRLHVHRRWIYLGLSAVLVLDLLVFFGWVPLAFWSLWTGMPI